MTAPVLEADGALLWFDRRELLSLADAKMRVEVIDAAAAEPWLLRLAGADRTRTALTDGTVELTASAELTRLALLLWARRWWPASPSLGVPALDPALLALEAAVATAAVDDRCDGMLDGFEATPAELFDAATAHGALPADARSLCERLSRWFDDQDDLDRAEAAARPAVPAATRRPHALAAGLRPVAPGDGILASGLASVDWALVPPGVLDAAADTVSWWVVTTAEATRAHVTVAGALGAAALRAVVAVGEREVAVVALERVDDQYRGVAVLDEAAVRLVAGSTVDLKVAANGVLVAEAGTTRADRAEVMSLVQARAGLPDALRMLAERVAGRDLDEF